MGMKARDSPTRSARAEVGEIDTSAPFESVKAAVSLFGEVAVTSDRSNARKPKPPPAERTLARESELHLAQTQFNKYKEQLSSAETTRAQALVELEKAKRSVDELTKKLISINKSKEFALEETEAAKIQAKQLEDVSSSNIEWSQELENARERYAATVAELDAAKQELRGIKKDFQTSMEAKNFALHQESMAKKNFDVNIEKTTQLSKEIETAQESLSQVSIASKQTQEEELKIRSEKDVSKQSFKQALKESEKKLEFLKKEFNPEVHGNLESKLAETTSEVDDVQKKLVDLKASQLQQVAIVTTELSDAKEVLLRMAEEDNSLRKLVEDLKLELETVKKEHAELKQKDEETESVVSNLHIKLQKCKAELEAAIIAESKAASASDDLMSALQQISSESQSAHEEAETMKRNAEDVRREAEASRIALAEAEKKLQAALKDAEEAKAAEVRAHGQIKDLSEKANATRVSTSSSENKITISKEEYDTLSRKLEESERLTEMKVAAAMAQVEAVRASENEVIKKLEAARKEMEDMEASTEDALRKAEMAEAAKRAIEGELRKWREKELKRAAEAASRILAETQISTGILASRPTVQNMKPDENSRQSQKTVRAASSKKLLVQNLSSMLYRRKNQADGGSPSVS